jgi:alcohol dehydrogenase
VKNLKDALGKMADGTVKPVIDSTIELDGIDAALARIESRLVFGKIIVTL